MTVSPAQRAQRRAAGRSSGKARARHSGDDEPAEDADPDAPLPFTGDPEVDKEMAAYDAVVGKPMSWPDVKNRVQTRAEIYKTRAAARQDQIDAKALITRDQLRARDEKLAEAIKSALGTAVDKLAANLPPDRIPAFQKACAAWVAEVREKLADEIEGMG